MNRRKFNNQADIIRLYRNGVTVEKLMSQFSAAYYTIRKVLRSELTNCEYKKIRHSNLVRGGTKTRFQPGQLAWNKGIHFDAGGRSHETRFKPGQIRGSAAQLYRPVGTITVRYHKSGVRNRRSNTPKVPYQWIKIKDFGPPRYCWVQYARYIYEKHIGPIPSGCFPVHKDGNTMNDDPSNLILFDRSSNLVRNGHRPEIRIVAHRRAVEHRKQNTLIRKAQNISIPKPSFYCPSCGWSSNDCGRPDRCPKCGYGSLENLKKKIA